MFKRLVVFKYASIFSLGLLMLCISCRHGSGDDGKPEDILVQAGDSVLTVRDVVGMIPRGLSQEDSLSLFNSIVDRWLRNLILSDVAENNLFDLDKIDKMVEDYKNDLIIDSYLRSMIDNRSDVNDSEIEDYYRNHGSEMKLASPIVKGIFVKVPDNDERLSDLRRWLHSPKGDAVDNIEKYGLRNASQYGYFMERWIDWEEIAEQIPYRFFDADAFLQSTKDFETSYGGSTYLLHISDFCPSESIMPYEYAYGIISNILDRDNVQNVRNRLIREIYKKKMSEGVLKKGLYDPLKEEYDQSYDQAGSINEKEKNN